MTETTSVIYYGDLMTIRFYNGNRNINDNLTFVNVMILTKLHNSCTRNN